MHWLPGEAGARAEVAKIRVKRPAIAFCHKLFAAFERQAVRGVTDVGIEVLLPVVALSSSLEDIPAQTQVESKLGSYVVIVLDEESPVGAGLGRKDILGEVIGFVARRLSHAKEEGCKVASVIGEGCGAGCGAVEDILASGKWWLADIHELLLIFNSPVASSCFPATVV